MTTKFLYLKKSLTLALVLILITAIVMGSYALFTDRAKSNTLNISTATFTKDGYTISREFNDVYYTAGDTISVKVKESNAKNEPVQSVVTMSVKWTSPDTSCSPFGNANAADNAVIKIDGTSVDYTVNADGTITFALPAHKMNSNSSSNERTLTFLIPESLKSTGKLDFSFDGVKLSQTTAMGETGFYAEYSHDELNTAEALDFTANVIWDFSAAQDKSVVGYLTGSNSNLGIQVDGTGAMYDWASGTASKQSAYKGSVKTISIGDGITTIGDNAFNGFGEITSIVIPKNVTELGSLSFGNCGKLTTITFNQASTANITFPTAGSSTGAFYVPSYLKTTFNFNGNADAKAYDWVTDNRMKEGITSATLAYDDVEVGKTVDPQLGTTPTTHDDFQSIKYEVISGSEYAKVDADTGVVTGLSKGTATIKVTIVDANGETVTTQGTVKVYLVTPILAPQNTWQGHNAVKKVSGNYVSYTFDSYIPDQDAIKTISIVDSYTPDGTESASWDASDPSVPGSVTAYLNADKTKLTIAGNGYGSIFANADSRHAFEDFTGATAINNTSLLDTSNVTDMGYMFKECAALTSLDVSNWKTGNVQRMDLTFDCCISLTSLDVSKWDVSNVTTMELMFDYCEKLGNLAIGSWDTGNVEVFNYMFTSCTSMTDIPVGSWDTSSGTSFVGVFSDTRVSSLDVAKWDTSKGYDFNRMFMDCVNLKSIDVSDWKVTQKTLVSGGAAKPYLSTYYMFTGTPIKEITLGAGWDQLEGTLYGMLQLTDITLEHSETDALALLGPAGNRDGIAYVGVGTYISSTAYTTSNPLRTTFHISNDTIQNIVNAYDWTTDCRGFTVTVESVAGGTVTADPAVAINGKTITLTPTANSGRTYNGATVTYTDKNGTAQTTDLAADELTFTMPAADVKITPAWLVDTPITPPDVDYKVQHWQQNVNGGAEQNSTNFTLKDTDDLKGTPGTTVTPDRKSYTGFTAPSGQSVTIAVDGSTVVNYYYTRNSYTFTLGSGTGVSTTGSSASGSYKYGATITLKAAVSSGYTFKQWTSSNTSLVANKTTANTTFTMPAGNITMTPSATGPVAQAIYSATDNSLTFIRDRLYRIGETYNGKTVTAVYTGFESATYTDSTVPWGNYKYNIKSVVVEDEEIPISPISTAYWFYEFRNCSNFDVAALNTSNVTSMEYMFAFAGTDSTTFTISDLSGWNTSNVENMQFLFRAAGSSSNTFNIGNIGKWDVSKVTNMCSMFNMDMDWERPSEHTTFYVGDLSSWNTSKVTDMYMMFNLAGYKCTDFNIGNIGKWDVSRVTNMSQMFHGTGYKATTFNIGKLDNWDVSKVTNMSAMFQEAGYSASTFNIGNLGNWDVSKVTEMSYLFQHAGYKASTFYIGDLSGWNTSMVEDMSHAFYETAYSATSYTIGDLSKWDTSNVTTMYAMFSGYCYNASYRLDLSGWNVNKVTNAKNFNYRVASKVIKPRFKSGTILSLSDPSESDLPDGVSIGRAQFIYAMPDVVSLNATAEAEAPANTALYGWLVNGGFGEQTVLLADFEETLHSVYDEEPEWTMTITPLYKAVETEDVCDHVYDEGVVTTEPTCTSDGVKTFTCTKEGCGATKTEAIPAGHTWNDGEVTTPATCMAEGVKTYTCTVEGCGATKTEAIAKAEHTYDEGVVTSEATCTSDGVKTFTCTKEGCGATKTEAIAKAEHTYDEGVVTTEATSTSEGVKTFTCTKEGCGATKTESIPVVASLDEGEANNESSESEA